MAITAPSRSVYAEQVMGTVVSLDVRAASEPTARAAFEQLMLWLRDVDERFSTYRSDSEISRIDRGELALAAASGDVRWVIARCARLRAGTGATLRGPALDERSGLARTQSDLLGDRLGELAPLRARQLTRIRRHHLDADVVGAGVAVLAHAGGDRFGVSPRDHRIDEPLAAARAQVVVAEPEPPQIVRVVRKLEIALEVPARARPRTCGISLEYDALLGREQRAASEDLSRTPRVLGSHEVRMCAGGAVTRQLEHSRAERRHHAIVRG